MFDAYRRKDIIYEKIVCVGGGQNFICIFSVISFLWRIMQGFRWPSDYVLTNHVISYKFGWVPRSFVGAIGSKIFGFHWYSWKCMSTVILGTSFVVVSFIVINIIKYNKASNFLGVVLLLAFSYSPHASYFIHENGYYEQYGYVLLIFFICIVSKIELRLLILMASAMSFLAIYISETNMFLIAPIFFVSSFIMICNDDKGEDKILNIVKLIFLFIPHIFYCIFVWVIKAPVEQINKLQEHDFEMVNQFTYSNFSFRWDVHQYMCGDRSNAESWGRHFHKIPLWCVGYVLLLVVFVAVILYGERKIQLMISYVIAALVSGFSSYVIVVVAWDLDRYYFCIFMSVFFVSLCVIEKYLKDIKYRPEYLGTIMMFLISNWALSSNRFNLFDGAKYNETVNEFLSLLLGRIG